MDTEAKPTSDDTWHVSNLLGRPIGSIVQTVRGFVMEHEDEDDQLLDGVVKGPHATLDLALSAIETATRGTCRLSA